MIALFTDYGMDGPYLGQVTAKLFELAPGVPVVNLMSDVPRQNPKAAAYLLPAVASSFPRGTIFFCVVDPGVGTGVDPPVAVKADDRWFVGPDNGLFDLLIRRSARFECRRIRWRPENLSATFHGRDLYAPVCAMLANGKKIPGTRVAWRDRHGWPDDLREVIYVDGFGNCMTGIRASGLRKSAIIRAGRRGLRNAVTFSAVRPGRAFWYENSCGLVEIAVNRGSAAEALRLSVGSTLSLSNRLARF